MRQDRTTKSVSFLFTVMIAFGGCASSQGLSHDALEAAIAQEESRFLDTSNAAIPSARPDAPRLGLYLKPTGFVGREFEWTSGDRDAVLAWSQRLPSGAGGKNPGFLTLSSLKGHTLTELRSTATRYGFDWLVVFDGAAAVDRYNNYKAGLWYWTIFGAYLADGTQSDALCLMKATLWDVKTGARLLTEQAEGTTKKVAPAALVDDREELEKARKLALEALLRRLTEKFAFFTGTRQ